MNTLNVCGSPKGLADTRIPLLVCGLLLGLLSVKNIPKSNEYALLSLLSFPKYSRVCNIALPDIQHTTAQHTKLLGGLVE